RRQPNVIVESLRNAKGKQDEKAYGVRGKGKAVSRLDYSIEGIMERGSDGSDVIRAWGARFGVAYSFNVVKSRPRIFGQYDFASGDNQPKDGVHGTFDTMYP